MKIIFLLTLVVPAKDHAGLLEHVGIQEVVAEDVSHFEFTENEIALHFNNAEDQIISLRGNDGTTQIDWRASSINIIRKFLELDMTK